MWRRLTRSKVFILLIFMAIFSFGILGQVDTRVHIGGGDWDLDSLVYINIDDFLVEDDSYFITEDETADEVLPKADEVQEEVVAGNEVRGRVVEGPPDGQRLHAILAAAADIDDAAVGARPAGDTGRAAHAGQRIGGEQARRHVGDHRRLVDRRVDQRDRAGRQVRDDRVLPARVGERIERLVGERQVRVVVDRRQAVGLVAEDEIEGADPRRRQGDEHADLRVPRQFVQAKVGCHVSPSRRRRAATRRPCACGATSGGEFRLHREIDQLDRLGGA